jgi:hypothetical protein
VCASSQITSWYASRETSSARLAAALDRVGQPLAVALGREVAPELVDQQPAVREDQHAEVARRLDEPGGRDRLAGRGRVAEAVAARGAEVLALEAGWLGLLVDELDVLVLLVLDLLHELRDGAVAGAVAVLVRAPLRRRDQLRQHPGEGVDLVAPEGRAGGGLRSLGGEHALEAEHQPVADLPARARALEPGGHLVPCVVERAAPGRAGGQRDVRLFARMEERLAVPALGASRRILEGSAIGGCRSGGGVLHVRSSLETRRSTVLNRSRKAARTGGFAPASLHPGEYPNGADGDRCGGVSPRRAAGP